MKHQTAFSLPAFAFLAAAVGFANGNELAEQQAVLALKDLGAEIADVPIRGDRLRAVLDRNDNNVVIGVHLLGSRRDKVADKHLKPAAALPTLERLVIFGGDISAKGLSYFEGHKTLTTLELQFTEVPAEALVEGLPRISCLEYLQLRGMPVTDSTLAKLAGVWSKNSAEP